MGARPLRAFAARARRASLDQPIFRLAGQYLRPRWKTLAACIACAVLFAGASGLLLKLLQPAIDELIVRPRPGALVRLPALIAGLALARGLAQGAQAVLANRIGAGVVGDLQRDLFRSFIRADLAQLRARHSGAFVSQMLYDAGLVREASTTGLVNAVQHLLTLLAAIAVMIYTDWRLGLVVLLVGPAIGAVLRRYARRSVRAAKGAMRSTSLLSSAILESLDGIRVVKMANREAYEEVRVVAAVRDRQDHILAGDNARAVAAPASETLMMWVVAAVLAYEGWRAHAFGGADIGGFLAFFAALMTAAQSLRQLANSVTVFGQGSTAAQRLFSTLDLAPQIRDRPGAGPLRLDRAHVRFEGVRFSYGAEPVLDGVDLEAGAGEIVALVGPSGGGKSTILNLVPRFFDVSAGRVTIDGQDVRDVALASLRDGIGLVTQEPFLFDDSVAANIAYGRADASLEAIEAAAKAAWAHDFICALPSGYDTPVGEAGVRLSGGQRQRIAIARVFLKDPRVLLLDEPTSALDAESEEQIQAALTKLMSGRVTILIAHRLSTVRNANRLYVVDKGRIVESGAHAALIRGRGLYSRLAVAQDLDHPPAASR